MTKALQVYPKSPSSVQIVAASFDGLLYPGESLSGTPTVTASPAGLTVDSPWISDEAVVIDGVTVAAGRAVLFRVADGQSRKKYVMTVTCGTDSSPAQRLVLECPLHVL